MALEEQEIDIPFVKGQETKTDPLLLPGDTPTSIINGYFAPNGSISRRDPWNDYTGSEVPAVQRGICAYGDEVLTVSGESLYSYGYDYADQFSRGTVSPCSMSKQSVYAGTTYADMIDVARSTNLGTNLLCYVWRDCTPTTPTSYTANGIYAMVRDEASGTVIYGPTLLSVTTTAQHPRVAAVTAVSPSAAAAFLVLWGDGANIKGVAINIGTLVATASANIFTDRSGQIPFAFYQSAGSVIVAYATGTAPDSVLAAKLAFTAGAITVVSGPVSCSLTATLPRADVACLALAAYSSSIIGVFALARGGAGNEGVWAGTLGATATTVTAGIALANKDATPAPLIGQAFITATLVGTTMLVFSDNPCPVALFAAAGTTTPLRTVGINSSNVVVQAAATALTSLICAKGACGPFIAGQAFTSGGKAYLPVYVGSSVTGDPNLQNTWFLYSESSDQLVGKALYGTFGAWTINNSGMTYSSIPPSTVVLNSGDFLCPVSERGQIAFAGGNNVNVTAVGVSRLVLDFSPLFSTAQVGPCQFFAGGILTQYDGRSVVEAGFHLFPEYVRVQLTGTGITGTYQYCALYEWTDDKGQRHQSAPSVPVTSSPANQTVRLKVPCLGMTAKSNVTIVLYRTATLGTTFYRLNDILTPIVNIPTSPMTADYDDTATDASITDNEVLYTVGGALDRNGPSFVGAVAAHQGRLWMVGLEDPTEFRFSQEAVASDGLAFNEALSGRIQPGIGALTAMAPLDDKAILYTAGKKLVVFGDGPNQAGLQGTYSSPQLLPSDIGCSEPRSIVNISSGQMYQSDLGIYLLNRALQDEYIGSPVENLVVGQAISSAVSVPDKAQVRFTLPDYNSSYGRMLTYDTQYGTWASHYAATATSMTGGCVWQGYYTFANGTTLRLGTMDADTLAGAYLDFNTHSIPVIWTSPKIHVGALGGFQRVRRLVLRGAFSADSAISILVTTPESSYTATLASSDAIDVGGYFTLRHHIALQKCNTIQFTITDTPAGGPGTRAGCNFSGMTLGVGIKKGTAKLPAASSM
jgi:hypothetical protein